MNNRTFPTPDRFPTPGRASLALLGALGVLLAASAALLMFVRAVDGRFDFHHFYLDAEYVWEHGQLNPDLDHPDPAQRRQLPFYLPVVPLLLAWLAPLGRGGAAAAWTLLQMLALLGSFAFLWRWAATALFEAATADAASAAATNGPAAVADGEPSALTDHRAGQPVAAVAVSARRIWGLTLIAALLCSAAILEAAKFNQLSFLVLFLLLAGVTAIVRRRPVLGGGLLALAAVLKLLPGLLLFWLLVKRQWRAAGAWAATFLLAALIPPLLAFGPQRTWDYHVEWWRYNIQRSAGPSRFTAEAAEHFYDHRNQSLPAVLARWSGAEPESLTLFSPAARLGQVLAVVLLLGLLWTTRRPWWHGSATVLQTEAAAYALMMLALAPLVRTYYLVWAWPAVLLALACWAARPPPVAARSVALLALWMLGMLGWALPAARSAGVHLWMLILMAGLLLLVRPRAGLPAGGAARTGGRA